MLDWIVMRNASLVERIVLGLDQALHTLAGPYPTTGRPNPADAWPEAELSPRERRHAAGLMRVDHAGEVCAQALYQGQALTARLEAVRERMAQAAAEENDHLEWCAQRLRELGSRPSLLNPFWYLGAFAIGAAAGLAGDRWSLGFVAETERQVVAHLEGHLRRLPPQDRRSRAILERMKEDEGRHATGALEAGGAELPRPVRHLMRMASRVMTTVAYYV